MGSTITKNMLITTKGRKLLSYPFLKMPMASQAHFTTILTFQVPCYMGKIIKVNMGMAPTGIYK